MGNENNTTKLNFNKNIKNKNLPTSLDSMQFPKRGTSQLGKA